MTTLIIEAALVAAIALGLWAIKAFLNEHIAPLTKGMENLSSTVDRLTQEMREQKADTKEDRNEMHNAVEAIRAMLSNHNTRISILETEPKGRARITATRSK